MTFLKSLGGLVFALVIISIIQGIMQIVLYLRLRHARARLARYGEDRKLSQHFSKLENYYGRIRNKLERRIRSAGYSHLNIVERFGAPKWKYTITVVDERIGRRLGEVLTVEIFLKSSTDRPICVAPSVVTPSRLSEGFPESDKGADDAVDQVMSFIEMWERGEYRATA